MNNCSICYENIRSSLEIKCVFCNCIICKNCIKIHILNPDTNKNAHCPACNREWSRGILIKYFSKNWVNKEYSGYNIGRAFTREKLLMPETQNIIKKEKDIKKLKDELSLIYEQISQLKIKAVSIVENINELKNKEDISESIDVKCKCPVDDCKGFIVNKWKCGICSVRICSNCRVIKPYRGKKEDPERLPKHVCKDSDVETFKLLKKDTKNCPKCACPIFKTEGCDQMWCVKCHTAFSWKTGKVETGVIHNPHYYELQRSLNGGLMPRNRGDLPCGGLPTIQEIMTFLSSNYLKKDFDKIMLDVHRVVAHILYDEIPIYRVNPQVDENLNIRIKYMTEEIDEEKFKVLLGRNLKKKEKNHEIYQILDMFANTMIILFNNIITSSVDYEKAKNLIIEGYNNMNKLREYTNKELNKIASIYECKLFNIADTWYIGKKISLVD